VGWRESCYSGGRESIFSGHFVEGAPASPIDPLNIGSLANVGFVGSMVFLGRIFKAIYEGAPAGPFCSFARQYRGLTRFGTSADDRAFGLVNWNLGRWHRECALLAPFYGPTKLWRMS
jgi:hypothetical protein